MGSLRMDLWRQTRESRLGRAAKRTGLAAADVTTSTWYAHRATLPVLRPMTQRPVAAQVRVSATR